MPELDRAARLVVLCLLLAGCSTEAEHPPAETATQQSGLGSVEALVDRLNQLWGATPVRLRESLALVYAENELQRRMVAIDRAALPVFDLAAAVHERFERPLIPDSPNFSIAPITAPYHLTERSSDRAQAEYRDQHGEPGVVHLVRIDGSWWISGYTYEYDDLQSKNPADLAAAESYVGTYARLAPGLQSRLEAGEFPTYEAFQESLREALRDAVGIEGR